MMKKGMYIVVFIFLLSSTVNAGWIDSVKDAASGALNKQVQEKNVQTETSRGENVQAVTVPGEKAAIGFTKGAPVSRSLEDFAMAERAVDKTSIVVWARTLTFLPTSSGTRNDKLWSWVPLLDFKALGPIPAGTRFLVEYSFPSGKPWISFDLVCDETAKGAWREFTRAGNEIPDDKGTSEAGMFGLKITLVNELESKREPLFNGKIEVKKYIWNKSFKTKFDYYVDQDWRLLYGFIYSDWYVQQTSGWNANPAPVFKTDLWFRGDSPHLEGFLFYKGKKIASSKANQKKSYSTFESSPYVWSLQSFWFNTVLVFNNEETNSHPDAHVLSSNPGEYEIKVLQDGKLSRTLGFTVGADGKLVDNGNCANLNCNRQIAVDVKLTGDTSSIKRENAFYGNPVR